MLLRQLISEGTATVSQAFPEREAREMVLLYLGYALGTSRHTHIIEPSYEVSDVHASDAMKAFARMAAGEPIQYIIGMACFYGRDFRVTPDVLIPRPETELLCRGVIDWTESYGLPSDRLRIADLCTGSGCIAWTLALELPGTEVLAVDISDGALDVAAGQSFGKDGCKSPSFFKADVLAGPQDRFGTFDVMVSNPPYVMESEKAMMRKNVLEHEPELALFVPDNDPLIFYRAVADWAKKLLKPGGLCFVEINESLGEETADVFRDRGFKDVQVVKDLSERDRFVRAIQDFS